MWNIHWWFVSAEITDKQKKLLPGKEDKKDPVLPWQQWWDNYLIGDVKRHKGNYIKPS